MSRTIVALLALALAGPAAPLPGEDAGTYRNPVLFADYSDPDVARRGDEYFMVASSFTAVPGLPILRSRDLVSWTIVGHAAERLPSPLFDRPQHGKGLWAPSIRFHDGLFWIYVGDPDRGILMTRARDPRGPWEPLSLVKEGKGLIDPCPLWDDDGSVYLVHAWAKSRAGFNAVLTVNRLSPDGRRAVDEGVTVFEGRDRHPTIEGPKFYKRGSDYYIFAPAGGVSAGWQTVLRSKAVLGPYEDRIVLERGGTDVNGPHQGAWVETPQGESWFLHFQERGAYGRIVHLQPMQWKDGWPVMGSDPDGDGRGEPVSRHRRPLPASSPPLEPQTSDAFDEARLGLQWQWQANPQAAWWSLAARPGALRLFPVALPEGGRSLWDAGNLLLQKLPAEAFTATTALALAPGAAGESAGLVVMGRDYAQVGLVRGPGGLRVEVASCTDADKGGVPRIVASAAVAGASVQLRATIGAGAVARFSYSTDGRSFVALGEPFVARAGLWVGAKIGLFAAAPAGTSARGWADFDWFRVDVGQPAASAGRAGAPPWSVRMADSEMARHPDPMRLDSPAPKWEYTHGLVLKSILEVHRRGGDEKYLEYARAYYDGMIDAAGDGVRTYSLEEYNIDRINPGKALFVLYEKTGEEKYRKVLALLRRQLKEHPRTSEGGFWHKKRYPHQMWLDGLYMGAPFLAQYGRVFGEPAAVDDAITQFVLMEKHARDPKTGLLYHGWDESRQQKWADPKTGLSPNFWGRAMGWYAMALVDVLDFVPADHPRRGELLAILGRLAEAILRVQDEKSGVFFQVLDQGSREGNYLEASASTMFSYALLKGARLGYLQAKHAEAGRRAYAGILREFIEADAAGQVQIHRVCQVAGLGGDPGSGNYRDGTYAYYVGEKIRSNDPKAVGPFILASLEMETKEAR